MSSESDKGSQKIRVASVSYFNAKPLIEGLEDDPSIEMLLDVPAGLLDLMRRKTTDVALLPVIDYQRLAGLRIVPAGGIGCEGPTLTVRIFSSRPIGEIESLACDPDSHTSVALARVILAERYKIRPEFVGLERAADAKLLIGDKVVCQEPTGMPHQIDLGEQWKALTGLPFLFAVWMARGEVKLGDLPEKLRRAKERGLADPDALVEQYAKPRGWARELARKYITHYLTYDVGERELAAMKLFHEMARRHGMLEGDVRGLEFYQE